jgi:hypothetical protein
MLLRACELLGVHFESLMGIQFEDCFLLDLFFERDVYFLVARSYTSPHLFLVLPEPISSNSDRRYVLLGTTIYCPHDFLIINNFETPQSKFAATTKIKSRHPSLHKSG